MDPVAALRQIAYYKDRAREDSRRVMAYRKAADVVEGLDDAQRDKHGKANSWQSLPGVGPKTAAVIAQAWAGREPDVLVELRSNAKDLGGGEIRAALRGDLHLHSNWSDGSAPISEMMATAKALGHEYCALTDHSPRLTVANGLSAGPACASSSTSSTNCETRSRPCEFSPASRSTSSTTAPSTRTTTCSNGSTSWSPACTRS